MLPALLSKITIEPWKAIDEQYRDRALPDLRPACVLVTAAVALVIPRFYGQERSLKELPLIAALFEGLPYPTLHPHLWWALFKLVNYGLLPVLCIKLALRARVRDHGLAFSHSPRVLLLYAGMLAVVAPFVYWASSTPAFLRTYPKYDHAGDSLAQLLIWEAAYGLQFMMLEFFFRGFLLFALARYIGSLALFVMVVPYAMIHLGKPFAECLGSIVAGVALGTVALRTGSIWGGVLVHCAVGWSMDLLALARTGKLQALF